jgi:hypothetical protein
MIGVRFWLTAWLLGLDGADPGGARHADGLGVPFRERYQNRRGNDKNRHRVDFC